MLKRRRSGLGAVLRASTWLLAGLLAIVGTTLVFAAPLAELVLTRVLIERGFGPAQLEVSRIDLGGLSLHRVALLNKTVTLERADFSFDWRGLLQRRLDAVALDGINLRLEWSADGTVSLGPRVLFPRPSQSDQVTSPAPIAAPAPDRPQDATAAPIQSQPWLRSLIVENSRVVLALPTGDVVVPVALTLAQDGNGRGLDLSFDGRGPGLDLKIAVAAVEPLDKPAQGSASVSYMLNGFSLPGLAADISGSGNISLSFDAEGARAHDSWAELAFTLDARARPGILQGIGLKLDRPVRFSLSGADRRPLTFALDRTAAIPTVLADLAVGLAIGATEFRGAFDGRIDVPLVNRSEQRADPQDFTIERLELTAKQWPIPGGRADAALRVTDFKGPIALAAGRLAAYARIDDLKSDVAVQRIEANLAAGFRLDGLSLSFDIADLWLEAEGINLGGATADGLNRIVLDRASRAAQQVNVVFGSAGSVTVTSDLGLAAAVPRLAPAPAAPDSGAASLTIPRLGLVGYLTHHNDRRSGNLKLVVADGRLTHPVVGLADIAAELVSDGRRLGGPISARLVEASDPKRPKQLDRRGAELRSVIDLSATALNIGGKLIAPPKTEVGTFSYTRRPETPATLALTIPPRLWSNEPSLLDAFGPLVALSGSTGTFGLDVRATLTGNSALAGTAKLTLADFGFRAGALDVQALNAAVELNQIWPPRAAAAQRLSFGRLVAGIPFTEGDFTIVLPGDGTVAIPAAEMKLAGGTVSGRNVAVPLDGSARAFALDIANVDLGSLIRSFAADGLTGNGKLAGRLPLQFADGRLLIERGQLGGRNGSIAYVPATTPAALSESGGTLVLKALSNFQYDELLARLDGDVTQDLAVSVTLKGRNPALYGGYPIEINLNLDGPLNRLVRDGLSGYRIPDDIKQRLEQQGISAGASN